VALAWSWSLIFALILLLRILAMFGGPGYDLYDIPSGSMFPNLRVGDHIFALANVYANAVPPRGQVVVFKYPQDRQTDFVKRVIGLPGDRVQVKDHEVWVNGKSLKVREAVTPNGLQVTESASEGQWQVMWTAADKRPPEADLTVPAGQVFVLGDNRNASTDSRSFGTVPLQDVLGKARQVWFSADAHGVRWGRLGKVLD
jgi:signal peptidase I